MTGRRAHRAIPVNVSESVRRRFWGRMAKTAHNRCWRWTARTNRDGYGVFCIGAGMEMLAHRVVWTWTYGLIPPGFFVIHTCDVAACANPAQLRAGTQADNVADQVRKHRVALGERNGTAKLTAQQVDEIRHRVRAGAIQQPLAQEYGVSPALVSLVVNRKVWRHLP
jgi:HNH endonuclease